MVTKIDSFQTIRWLYNAIAQQGDFKACPEVYLDFASRQYRISVSTLKRHVFSSDDLDDMRAGAIGYQQVKFAIDEWVKMQPQY